MHLYRSGSFICMINIIFFFQGTCMLTTKKAHTLKYDKLTDGLTHRQMDRHTGWLTDGQIDRQSMK